MKKLGRTQLVIAGIMTHMCVSSTARAALDLGYKATVAAEEAENLAWVEKYWNIKIKAAENGELAYSVFVARTPKV